MKKIYWKIISKIIDRYNHKLTIKIDNEKFIQELCTVNRELDLDKYFKLIKMLKKRYK